MFVEVARIDLDAGAFQHLAAEARELWTAEKVAFPESAAYMDRLLERLDAPAKSVKTENPA